MTVKAAIAALHEGKLDIMKQQFNAALTDKAIGKLEERKIEVGKTFLGDKK